jgi:cyanophycin synthetase
MRLHDSRRLTGLNLSDERPGAAATVRFDPGEDAAAAIERWRLALARGLAELHWDATLRVRRSESEAGDREAELMFTAEIDRLYAAADLGEWAVRAAEGEAVPLDTVRESAAREIAVNAGLLALVRRGRAEGVPSLCDDEMLTLGWGARGRTWPIGALPPPTAIEWSALGQIPLALVTGTNGKTTTSRLLARIARLAGHRVGNTSTDGIYVDEALVEAGDWTGPGAARTLLRRTEVELAILEAARGGLLRRGLEITGCDVALVTNIERDHLGEYGIFDLPNLAAVKGLVTRAVRPGGRIVLGADSPALVAWARTQRFAAPVEWVTTDPESPVLQAHTAAGGSGWTCADGLLVRRRGGSDTAIIPAADVPITFGGKARHNVANALAAAAVASALGLSHDAISSGLRDFGSRPTDNPGRARAFTLSDGRDLLLDFAHNAAGLQAIGELVRALGRRAIVSFGMAGDRSDEDLRTLGTLLVDFAPRHVILREQPAYLRGRKLGEVPALLAEGLRRAGFPESAIHLAGDEPSALDLARALADPEELLLLLLHTERDAVAAWLERHGARPATW